MCFIDFTGHPIGLYNNTAMCYLKSWENVYQDIWQVLTEWRITWTFHCLLLMIYKGMVRFVYTVQWQYYIYFIQLGRSSLTSLRSSQVSTWNSLNTPPWFWHELSLHTDIYVLTTVHYIPRYPQALWCVYSEFLQGTDL